MVLGPPGLTASPRWPDGVPARWRRTRWSDRGGAGRWSVWGIAAPGRGCRADTAGGGVIAVRLRDAAPEGPRRRVDDPRCLTISVVGHSFSIRLSERPDVD